ncbi:MAG: hypothetical protein R3B94_11255 [Hyphomonas sp.]
MMNDLTAHIAKTSGLAEPVARQALGIVLNAADRQTSPFAAAMFKSVPGARALAARTGSELGAPVGEIARMIEQTPGGKRRVAREMITALHGIGLDHKDIGALLPAISAHMEETHGLTGFGHLGDLIGSDLDGDLTAGDSGTKAA